MGTEIFPHILAFAKFIVGAVAAVSLLTVVVGAIEFYRGKGDKKKQAEFKEYIISGLIAIVIALIVYFLLSGIGPAFRILLGS